MSRIVCLDCMEREQEQGEFLRTQMLRFLNDMSASEINDEAMNRLEWGSEGTLASVILDILKERAGGPPDGQPTGGE